MRILKRCLVYILAVPIILATEQSKTIECEKFGKRSDVSTCLISDGAVVNDVGFSFAGNSIWNIETIIFEANPNILFLPSVPYYGIVDVISYIAKNCSIVEISEFAFGRENGETMEKLKTIDLSWNRIKSIESKPFSRLSHLENLLLGKWRSCLKVFPEELLIKLNF